MSLPLPSKSDIASEGMDVDDKLVKRTLGSDAENEPEDKVAKEETDRSTTDPESEDKESSDDDAHNDNNSEGEEVLSVPVEGQSGNCKATAEELAKAKEDEAAARAKVKAEAEKAMQAKVKEEARAKAKKEKERGKEKEKATALAQSVTKQKDRKEKEGSKGSNAVTNVERSKVVVEKGNKPVPEEVAKLEKKKLVTEKEKVDTRRDGKEKRVIVIPQAVTKPEKKKEDKSKEKEPVLVLLSKKHTIVEVEILVSGKETRAKNRKVVVESSSKEDEDIPLDWAEGMVFHTPECMKCAERHKGPQGSTRQTMMDWLCHSNLNDQGAERPGVAADDDEE
ncbi:uncharacterized protein FOMMEDRAFT_163672 [Fomitiporia mediterranea MF3/22]|uniref:Uncharacterized protein n=1 Tax=Fomitiporia mediterranea (strain MF3/22) TaxID=694068 RepID=R7SGG0_FOMME|nr:uncharacterized protein FOMMEDRAFT_163672 [Fomitiporia mediterranea MF3/22]EJC97382.1 hypothetical protein FOMMEDRAFT_163672 [Fomitiporia mediterranea MF3/22]